ncbi:MAG: type 1 glutamine amidotransferase domain-containing protein [Thermoanaerobaculia bacterium]
MARILVPLPDRDFDVTECAVPWKLLRDAGHEVVFATAAGAVPNGDPLLLTGVVFGLLGAESEAKEFYRELETSRDFRAPLPYAEIVPAAFDALLLPGGHAPGMRPYLESEVLRAKVAAFWNLARPVAAICHGVLVLARATDPATGRSLLAHATTTCLPGYMERTAYFATAWKLDRYYRTYPAYVEEEVKGALADPSTQFRRGPLHLFAKGTRTDDRAAFVVEDRNYLSARWPGDAYLLAKKLVARLA